MAQSRQSRTAMYGLIAAAAAGAIALGVASMWRPDGAGGAPGDWDAETRRKIDEQQQAAARYIQGGKLLEARVLLLDLLKKYQKSAETHTLLAQVLMQENKTQEAYDALLKSLELDDAQDGVHHLAGSLAQKLNQPEKARYHYGRAVSLAPNNGRHRVFLANMLLEENNVAAAQQHLLIALQHDSTLHEAHFTLAKIAETQGKLLAAVEQINKALAQVKEDDPKRLKYVVQKAVLLRRDGKGGDALNVLMTLPVEQQRQELVVEQIAQTYLLLSESEKAASVWAELFLHEPANARAAAEAGLCYLRAGDAARAARYLRHAQQIDPNQHAAQALAKALQGGDAATP